MNKLITMLMAGLVMGLLLTVPVQSAFAGGKWSETVRTIDWSRFEEPEQISDAFVLSSKINANAARYTHAWAPWKYRSSEGGDYFILPTHKNHLKIRPATSAALGLAVSIRTGIDPEQIGVSKAELTETAAKLIKGAAVGHRINGGTWGHTWQSGLMSGQLARAAWLMWEDIDEETREMVCTVIIDEADRLLRIPPPYWNGKGGDSKAEENSWNAMILHQAVVMLPDHPHARKWKEMLCEYQISAYAMPQDMEKDEPLVDGKSPREWLNGYNVREDGIVINHNLMHNDYMVSMAHCQMSGTMVFALAGLPAPESTDYNFDVIYRTLVTKQFDAPPYESPGGTMYIPGSPEQYYPQATDWSNRRYACFYGMDGYASVLGHDKGLPHKAEHWEKLRGEKIFEMQSRHADGHMYKPEEWANYWNREFMVYWAFCDVQLLRWLDDRNALTGKANLLEDVPGNE